MSRSHNRKRLKAGECKMAFTDADEQDTERYSSLETEDADYVVEAETDRKQLDEVMRESVLSILDSPEQLAALTTEDRRRVELLANRFRPDERLESESVQTEEVAEESEAETEVEAEMTPDENLARTMLLLHGEMGAALLSNMPNSVMLDILSSIARIVGGGASQTSDDADWTATLELLDCSSAGNLVQRLEAWPTCAHRLNTCATTSEFESLFADTMRELRVRGGGDERPTTVRGEYQLGECDVCCSATNALLWRRGCCETSVCVVCLHRWLVSQLTETHSELACPGCDTALTEPELRHLLSDAALARREQLLARRHGDHHGMRDCPRCSCMAQRPSGQKQRPLRGSSKREKEQGGVLVTCQQCDYLWCFDCHSPVHRGLSCRQFRCGAQQLEFWAKQLVGDGVLKARRCPRCKVLIERNDGCDHMTCSHCHHEFCYLCGRKWDMKEVTVPFFGWSIFGSHSDRFSIFGCKQKFMPDRPALRRFIRGSLFILRCLGLVLASAVGVAVAVALLGIALACSPILIPFIIWIVDGRRSVYGRGRQRRDEETSAAAAGD